MRKQAPAILPHPLNLPQLTGSEGVTPIQVPLPATQQNLYGKCKPLAGCVRTAWLAIHHPPPLHGWQHPGAGPGPPLCHARAVPGASGAHEMLLHDVNQNGPSWETRGDGPWCRQSFACSDSGWGQGRRHHFISSSLN